MCSFDFSKIKQNKKNYSDRLGLTLLLKRNFDMGFTLVASKLKVKSQILFHMPRVILSVGKRISRIVRIRLFLRSDQLEPNQLLRLSSQTDIVCDKNKLDRLDPFANISNIAYE
jgi:hypothetical protein